LVKVAKSIETPFLWIHTFTLKMVQAWPAWSARHFSFLWQIFIFESLPCYLSFYQLNRMFLWKAGNIETISHHFDNCIAISVNQVSSIERIFLGIGL